MFLSTVCIEFEPGYILEPLITKEPTYVRRDCKTNLNLKNDEEMVTTLFNFENVGYNLDIGDTVIYNNEMFLITGITHEIETNRVLKTKIRKKQVYNY